MEDLERSLELGGVPEAEVRQTLEAARRYDVPPMPAEVPVIEGRIENGDEVLRTGEWADRHAVDARAGDRLSVTLESGDFDAYLVLAGPGGINVQNDDFPGMGTNSRVDAELPDSGTYVIGVTTGGAGQTGGYRLRIWRRENR